MKSFLLAIAIAIFNIFSLIAMEMPSSFSEKGENNELNDNNSQDKDNIKLLKVL